MFSNPHVATVAAYLWPHRLDERRFPVERKLYRTEPGVEVLVESQRPAGTPRGEIVMVHGLEGSSRARYLRRAARGALEAGWATHRLNLRSCGGTEAQANGGYHSGLTTDLRAVLEQLRAEGRGPLFATGVSLGGNLVLKLAGELGEHGRELLAGVCAISPPIDLAACVGRLETLENRYYERRFLKQLKRRVNALHCLHPERLPLDGIESVASLREFDNRFTARWFGFRDGAEYYDTQSSRHFLAAIRIPALIVQAKDDPMIPFEIFERPEARGNPCVELVATEHGGHLGFVSRRRPVLWADRLTLEWMERHAG
ncbi:MAG TPA: alpha/beta fold hydrolase [Bryobacteraceae bacterium]|nr:alpha/beta fold hydrolase [Bryobacteraceae bacterium]